MRIAVRAGYAGGADCRSFDYVREDLDGGWMKMSERPGAVAQLQHLSPDPIASSICFLQVCTLAHPLFYRIVPEMPAAKQL